MEYPDLVIITTLSVLGAIFVGSLIAIIIICRNRFGRSSGYAKQPLKVGRPEVYVLSNQDAVNDLDLDDVGLEPIENILSDERWVDDATGLIPHCLDLLRTCHQLTEYLMTIAMSPVVSNKTVEIIEVSRTVSPRVDDVVRSMYPPLDPRLLEARCTSLVLTVTQLALVVRSACSSSRSHAAQFQLIGSMLTRLNNHLKVLREAALDHEATLKVCGSVQGGSPPSSA